MSMASKACQQVLAGGLVVVAGGLTAADRRGYGPGSSYSRVPRPGAGAAVMPQHRPWAGSGLG